MNELERFHDITTFILDVDGVLTNSQLIVQEDGTLLRMMNVRDGYAIKRAIQQGFRVCIITGGKSMGVVERVQRLGVVDVYYGVQDKVEAYRSFMELHELDDGEVLFMGDDMPDYAVMRLVGFPACPRDACPEIVAISKFVSDKGGGAGAVRDVIERTLRLKGKWMPGEEDETELPRSV
jgi:3-deoxy-D-manno-octulosonate 8-phosphate phosphatase (KDO 8-P phosphatase)